jgi:hypothetical protein
MPRPDALWDKNIGQFGPDGEAGAEGQTKPERERPETVQNSSGKQLGNDRHGIHNLNASIIFSDDRYSDDRYSDDRYSDDRYSDDRYSDEFVWLMGSFINLIAQE